MRAEKPWLTLRNRAVCHLKAIKFGGSDQTSEEQEDSDRSCAYFNDRANKSRSSRANHHDLALCEHHPARCVLQVLDSQVITFFQLCQISALFDRPIQLGAIGGNMRQSGKSSRTVAGPGRSAGA